MYKRICKWLPLAAVLIGVSLEGAASPQDDLRLQRDRQLVRDVQQALLNKGYAAGPVDGIVGPQTRAALSKFQEDQGIEVTGRMTDETLRRLEVEIPPAGSGDEHRRGGVVGVVGSAATTAAGATAEGVGAAARGTAKGATAVAKGTAAGAEAAAKATATGAQATAKGVATGAEAAAEGATTGAKAAAGGVETGAEATAEGAKTVARGTARVAGGAKNLLLGKDEDEKIRDRVIEAFKQDSVIDPDHFQVKVEDRIVILHLKAGDRAEWNRAVAVARRVQGVDKVFIRRH